MKTTQSDGHLIGRIGWLRAAVLGANDGIISTSSLILGVASASHGDVLLAGIAGWVAGAMSMAAGEYVSVSSQADTEKAELKREMVELSNNPSFEVAELAAIYVERGVTPAVATVVAQQLMAKDAIGAHARDELGISTQMTARPVQAALTSAFCFSIGAGAPLALVLVSPEGWVVSVVAVGSVMFLAVLGAVGARVGGAGIIAPTLRVLLWGTAAMAITAGVGKLFGTVV